MGAEEPGAAGDEDTFGGGAHVAVDQVTENRYPGSRFECRDRMKIPSGDHLWRPWPSTGSIRASFSGKN
jgi:hypothetical protein